MRLARPGAATIHRGAWPKHLANISALRSTMDSKDIIAPNINHNQRQRDDNRLRVYVTSVSVLELSVLGLSRWKAGRIDENLLTNAPLGLIFCKVSPSSNIL